MKNRGLITAALVLAALSALLYWSNRHKPADTSATLVPTPVNRPPGFLTLKTKCINKIELKKKGADQIVLVRDSNNSWRITAPKSTAVDDSAVEVNVVQFLSSLNFIFEWWRRRAQTLVAMAWPSPPLSLVLLTRATRSINSCLGDNTPTGLLDRMRNCPGHPRVFTVASFTRTNLDKGLNDLRDKRLITLSADKISRIALTANQQSMEFGRDKNQWQILETLNPCVPTAPRSMSCCEN